VSLSDDAPMRTTLLLILALVACGGGKTAAVDAAPGPAPDAPPAPLALDCTIYCTRLQADCSGDNAQIKMENCMGVCLEYTRGTQADMMGNTLGCRNYPLQNIEVRGMSAATHCPHTGLIGGLAAGTTSVCGVSPCDDFCDMQTKVCGTAASAP